MNNQKGFTTIELLIALGLMVIVLIIAMMMVGTARADSRDAIRLSDIQQIKSGLELHFAEQFTYPIVTAPVVLGTAQTICLDTAGFGSSCTSDRPYLPSVPANTTANGTAYVYMSRTAEGANCAAGPCAAYVLQFSLEHARVGLVKGLNCATPEGISPGACR